MSERLLEKLYIGIDLKEESAMLSYFHPGMERPATVSFVAGSSEYSLPLAACISAGCSYSGFISTFFYSSRTVSGNTANFVLTCNSSLILTLSYNTACNRFINRTVITYYTADSVFAFYFGIVDTMRY